jgi:hypothetical protein
MLDKTDLQSPRTPSALNKRCAEIFEALGATYETRQNLWHKVGLCKELVEEIYPASIWGKALFGDVVDVTITPTIDSGPRDALVSTPDGDFPIEITQAHTGESDHLRMLHLEKHGWAPGPTSEMCKEGTKRTGIVVTPGRVLETMIGHPSQAKGLIEDAVKKKAAKPYPKETRLIVMFEDFVVKDDENIKKELFELIGEIANTTPLPFSVVYLVGWSGKLFITYPNEI